MNNRHLIVIHVTTRTDGPTTTHTATDHESGQVLNQAFTLGQVRVPRQAVATRLAAHLAQGHLKWDQVELLGEAPDNYRGGTRFIYGQRL